MNFPSHPAKLTTACSLLALGAAVALMPRPHSSYASPNPGEAVRTYREGSRLYLDNGTLKVGLETKWGGSIVEVNWHGMNFVNDFDAGREIQVAVYDGDPYPPCNDCSKEQGWNPVQGGDWHTHGSPLLAQTLERDSIYTKTQPLHWQPDNKGGGPDKPVPSDVFIEQWVSFLPDDLNAVKVRYRITHFGSDRHASTLHEFPAVYANPEFSRFVYYAGDAPWTNAPVSFLTMPERPKSSPPIYVSEDWGGFVNNDDVGLTVYVPGQFPYTSGFRTGADARKKFATNYFAPHMSFQFGPNTVLEGDAYIFAGDYRKAREAIYSLHRSLPHRISPPPYGVVDEPKRKTKAAGPLNISGWAIGTTQLSEVDVSLDNRPSERADYGVPRPDVVKLWSHAPAESGFRYTLDTTKYPNGDHTLAVSVKDSAGNVAVLARIPIVIDNPAAEAQPK